MFLHNVFSTLLQSQPRLPLKLVHRYIFLCQMYVKCKSIRSVVFVLYFLQKFLEPAQQLVAKGVQADSFAYNFNLVIVLRSSYLGQIVICQNSRQQNTNY